MLTDFWSALFDARTHELKQGVDRFLGGVCELDVLTLDVVEIVPEHRGGPVGLAAAGRYIDLFGRGCRLLRYRSHVGLDVALALRDYLRRYPSGVRGTRNIGAFTRAPLAIAKVNSEEFADSPEYLVLRDADRSIE